MNTTEYNREYFQSRKARIMERRNARRLVMTEDEREKARASQRERSKRHAIKRRTELNELVALATELLEKIDHV